MGALLSKMRSGEALKVIGSLSSSGFNIPPPSDDLLEKLKSVVRSTVQEELNHPDQRQPVLAISGVLRNSIHSGSEEDPSTELRADTSSVSDALGLAQAQYEKKVTVAPRKHSETRKQPTSSRLADLARPKTQPVAQPQTQYSSGVRPRPGSATTKNQSASTQMHSTRHGYSRASPSGQFPPANGKTVVPASLQRPEQDAILVKNMEFAVPGASAKNRAFQAPGYATDLSSSDPHIAIMHIPTAYAPPDTGITTDVPADTGEFVSINGTILPSTSIDDTTIYTEPASTIAYDASHPIENAPTAPQKRHASADRAQRLPPKDTAHKTARKPAEDTHEGSTASEGSELSLMSRELENAVLLTNKIVNFMPDDSRGGHATRNIAPLVTGLSAALSAVYAEYKARKHTADAGTGVSEEEMRETLMGILARSIDAGATKEPSIRGPTEDDIRRCFREELNQVLKKGKLGSPSVSTSSEARRPAERIRGPASETRDSASNTQETDDTLPPTMEAVARRASDAVVRPAECSRASEDYSIRTPPETRTVTEKIRQPPPVKNTDISKDVVAADGTSCIPNVEVLSNSRAEKVRREPRGATLSTVSPLDDEDLSEGSINEHCHAKREVTSSAGTPDVTQLSGVFDRETPVVKQSPRNREYPSPVEAVNRSIERSRSQLSNTNLQEQDLNCSGTAYTPQKSIEEASANVSLKGSSLINEPEIYMVRSVVSNKQTPPYECSVRADDRAAQEPVAELPDEREPSRDSAEEPCLDGEGAKSVHDEFEELHTLAVGIREDDAAPAAPAAPLPDTEEGLFDEFDLLPAAASLAGAEPPAAPQEKAAATLDDINFADLAVEVDRSAQPLEDDLFVAAERPDGAVAGSAPHPTVGLAAEPGAGLTVPPPAPQKAAAHDDIASVPLDLEDLEDLEEQKGPPQESYVDGLLATSDLLKPAGTEDEPRLEGAREAADLKDAADDEGMDDESTAVEVLTDTLGKSELDLVQMFAQQPDMLELSYDNLDFDNIESPPDTVGPVEPELAVSSAPAVTDESLTPLEPESAKDSTVLVEPIEEALTSAGQVKSSDDVGSGAGAGTDSGAATSTPDTAEHFESVELIEIVEPAEGKDASDAPKASVAEEGAPSPEPAAETLADTVVAVAPAESAPMQQMPGKDAEGLVEAAITKHPPELDAVEEAHALHQGSDGAALGPADGVGHGVANESYGALDAIATLPYIPDANYSIKHALTYLDLFFLLLTDPNDERVTIQAVLGQNTPLFDVLCEAIRSVGLTIVSSMSKQRIGDAAALQKDFDETGGFFRFRLAPVEPSDEVEPWLLKKKFTMLLAEGYARNMPRLRELLNRQLRALFKTPPSVISSVREGVVNTQGIFFDENDAARLCAEIADSILDDLVSATAEDLISMDNLV